MRNDRSDIVVVGVDGSVASVSALVAGLRDARARRLTVEVVTAWSEHGPHGVEQGYMLARAARRRALRAQLAVMARAGRFFDALPPVSAVIVEGDPADVLLRAAEGVDRLVLGVSDRDETAESLFHAIRERCIRAADCPVLVVPESWLSTEVDEGHVDVPIREDSHAGA